MIKKIIFALIFCISFSFNANASSFDDILKKGFVSCGVYKYNLSYYLEVDTQSVTMCKIFAYALLGKENALNLMPFEEDIRLEALKEDIVDISFATITWTMRRDIDFDISFPALYFFEKQVFVTFPSYDIKTLKTAPQGTKICVPVNTTVYPSVLKVLRNYPEKNFDIVLNQTSASREKSFLKNHCEITSGEIGVLFYLFKNDFKRLTIMSDNIGFTPIAVAVKNGNIKTKKFVKWMINGMLYAGKLGITKNNVDKIIKTTNNKEILFMLGETKGIGKAFGIDDKWLYRIIKKYGNQEEFFKDINKKYHFNGTTEAEMTNEDRIYPNGRFYPYPFL